MMEKQSNRRKFILMANMGVGLSDIVAQKLASISDSNTIVVVSPSEVKKVPENKPIVLINTYKDALYETDVNINPHSTGGTHKGGKKNKRNKRW